MWKLHIRPVSASVEAKNIAFGRSLHLMHAGVTILYNSFFTAWQFSSLTASNRCPDSRTSWGLDRSRRNSVGHCLTVACEGTWFPWTLFIWTCLLGWVFAICETDYYSDSAPEKFMAYVVTRLWYSFVLLQENIQVPVKFSARCCHWLRGNVTYLTGDIFVVIIHCDTTWKCLACAQELVSSQFSQSQKPKISQTIIKAKMVENIKKSKVSEVSPIDGCRQSVAVWFSFWFIF